MWRMDWIWTALFVGYTVTSLPLLVWALSQLAG
jgi:hypothetical protein